MSAVPSILPLSGPLTLSAAEEVRGLLQSHALPGADLQLDLSAVSGCDAAGLQLLWAARRTLADQGGRLQAISPSPAVLQAAQELGFDLGTLTLN